VVLDQQSADHRTLSLGHCRDDLDHLCASTIEHRIVEHVSRAVDQRSDTAKRDVLADMHERSSVLVDSIAGIDDRDLECVVEHGAADGADDRERGIRLSQCHAAELLDRLVVLDRQLADSKCISCCTRIVDLDRHSMHSEQQCILVGARGRDHDDRLEHESVDVLVHTEVHGSSSNEHESCERIDAA